MAAARAAAGSRVALPRCVCTSVARVIDRARAEFVEMPGLELTVAQAARLWNLSLDDCRSVIEVLAAAGFLRWTPWRTVVRTGRDLVVAFEPIPDHSVSIPKNDDKSVGID